MNLFIYSSISKKITFHSILVLMCLGLVFWTVTLPLSTGGPDTQLTATSLEQPTPQTPPSSANGLSPVARLGLILGFCALSAFAIGWIARLHLRELTQLGDAADHLLNFETKTAPLLPSSGTLEVDRLANSFNGMRSQIEGLLRNLREMMDHIAHDILTPVTRLRGHAEIQLHRPDYPPQIQETCGHVVEECDHILNLVNAILKLAAVESGLKTWKWESLDLVSLIQDGCDLFTPVIDHNHQTLSVTLPQTCIIRGDRSAIQRMIANFLDNAIKYTPPGGKLQVGLHQDEDQVHLSFADNGVGIDEKEQSLVFQRFYRGDQSRSKPGHGLGLSYCFFVVRAMGGNIQLKSQRELGSTFTVTFPNTNCKAA